MATRQTKTISVESEIAALTLPSIVTVTVFAHDLPAVEVSFMLIGGRYAMTTVTVTSVTGPMRVTQFKNMPIKRLATQQLCAKLLQLNKKVLPAASPVRAMFDGSSGTSYVEVPRTRLLGNPSPQALATAQELLTLARIVGLPPVRTLSRVMSIDYPQAQYIASSLRKQERMRTLAGDAMI